MGSNAGGCGAERKSGVAVEFHDDPPSGICWGSFARGKGRGLFVFGRVLDLHEVDASF